MGCVLIRSWRRRSCGSTAWCVSLWIVHNWWLGHFPALAQDEYFAGGPDTLSSTCLNPTGGKAVPVAGGFRVSGRWSFSSGCDVSTWAMVAVPGAGPGTMLWLLIPRSDYGIVDTWFASGMRGSGSNDIVVEDVFVPAHRMLDPERAGDRDMTGWELHGRPSYRVPLRLLTGWDLAGPEAAYPDPLTDFADWTDEIHTIYPDGVVPHYKVSRASRAWQAVAGSAAYSAIVSRVVESLGEVGPVAEPRKPEYQVIWPEDVDDTAARRDWDFSPSYDFDRAFHEYLIPNIRHDG